MLESEAHRNRYVNNLRLLITTSGYKLIEVANELQIPRSTLYGYLSGKRPIPRQCLVEIVNFLARDISEFRYVNLTALLAEVQETPALVSSLDREDKVESGEQASAGTAWIAAPTPVPDLSTPATDADYAVWFGKKLAYLMTVIADGKWQGHDGSHELQKWVDKEIHMFDDIKPLWASDGYSMSRREAIIAIAALPVALLTAAQNLPRSALVKQEFLFRCSASITACWHLMAGRDFEEVEEAVTPYLPVLMRWSREPSEFQRQSADLAAQGQILVGLVSLHIARSPYSIQKYLTHAKQAAAYGQLSGNASLHVAMLIAHGNASFRYSQRYEEMVQVCQQALQHLNEVSPLEQSMIYSALAEAYGYNGKSQEALRYIELAHEIRPATIDYLPPFLAADNGVFGRFWEGRAYLALGERYPEGDHLEQAWNTLAQVECFLSTDSFPERIRIEIVNQQGLAAVKMGDLDQFRVYLERGIRGAHALHSEKRLQEAMDIYRQARMRWPDETRIRDLADLFVSMN